MSLVLVLDLLGVFVFAVSGAMTGVRNRLDIFGVFVLAGVTALGGGIVRDLLIDAAPPAGLRDWRYLLTAGVAGLLTFVLHGYVERLARLIRVFDAAGLGLFAVSGTAKALDFGLGPVPALALGVITGIGGGVLRDMLAGEVPFVLRREIYALAALVGAVIVVVADEAGVGTPTAVAVVGATATFLLRMVSVWRGWNAPIADPEYQLRFRRDR